LRAVVEELRAAHPEREITLRCPPLPSHWDPDRLEQVFSNLIGNAVLHGDPAGPITVQAYPERESVCVEVHNQGPPIPDELQPIIFDPFRRGERDGTTPQTLGLGLGLYISREVIHAHGGQIDFQSNRTAGTTFRVTLPRAEGVFQENHMTDAMSHTVFLIEDEKDLREMMREALELNGYSVVTAGDGQQALAKLSAIQNLCLVILDLVMPGMNGWEFFEKMRQRTEFAAVPVVIYTSSPGRAPQGATRVLQKPTNFDRLLSTVREYCPG
jgi:CheY-like chemotaxis protein